MPQPVGFYSGVRLSDDDPAAPQPISYRPPRNPNPPEPPDVDTDLYAEALRNLSATPNTQTAALKGAAASRRATDAQIQQRLTTFRAEATALYQTPEGDALVTVPFQMAGRTASAANAEVVRVTALRLGMSDEDTQRIALGRGTPRQIVRIAQALISGGRLPPPQDREILADRVRRMMYEHGLAMDCAAYTSQAFLASRNIDRANSPFGTVSVLNDDLSNLQNRGFVRVSVDQARPGDIVVLGPPNQKEPGHRAIVYASREATDKSRAFLLGKADNAIDELQDKPAGLAVATRNRYLVATRLAEPNLRALVVDSSWGAHGQSGIGGVEQRIWVTNAAGSWVSTDGYGDPSVSDLPYGHPLVGIYRPASEL